MPVPTKEKTVEILIHSRNMEVTQRIEEYVTKKAGRLDRYLPALSDVRVDLAEENARNSSERYGAQVTIRDEHGTILRAEERSSDIFRAVDAVVDKLYRQINRYRGKRVSRRRNGEATEELFEPEPLPLEEEELEGEWSQSRTIARKKRFPLQPMSVDEAIDQMELLGHDFFIFFNPDEEAVNVVYKRHDGGYGLLMPELY